MNKYNNQEELGVKIAKFRTTLIKTYGKIVPKAILNQYLPPEKALVVNDDKNMMPFDLKLPEPPALHKINGFGLPSYQQRFVKQEMPQKLKDLVAKTRSMEQIWEMIDKKRKQEIIWLQKQWHYRIHGYWFWNNGVPTYITGAYFFFLNYWTLNRGLPEYRYRDRIFFQFAKYCWEASEALFHFRVKDESIDGGFFYFSSEIKAERYIVKKNLKDTQVEHGYWIKKYNKRVCYGFNYPKHRREGATYKAACMNFEVISRMSQVRGLILSKDGESTAELYKIKILDPVKQMPFFFMPVISGSMSKVMEFDAPLRRNGAKGTILPKVKGLMSDIKPSTTSDERKEDGNEFYFVHEDEVGKINPKQPYNSIIRYDVVKKTIATGKIIRGLIARTSTSDDSSGDAGRRYMEICGQSHWHERDYVTGQTESGLFNLFIPAYVNLEGFTDPFGNPIIENPKGEMKKYANEEFGAREWIQSNLDNKRNNPDVYYNTMREFPTEYRHCFMSAGEDSGFDLLKLVNRISELDMNRELKPRRGNFEWTNGWGSDVKFIDKKDGKFFVSYIPATPNKRIYKYNKEYPGNTHEFNASCDPFRYDTTRGSRQSFGAGSVYLKRDEMIDPDGKNRADWITDRFCCTYKNKVTEEIYKDDMAKMAVFYGCEIFPEMNEEMVYKYFRDSKLKPYLGYLYREGTKDAMAGFYTSAPLKKIMFKLWKIKIESSIEHEVHGDVLQELAAIESPEDLKNFDLTASGGGNLLAMYYAKSEFGRNRQNDVTDNSLLDYVMNLQTR